MNLFFNIITKKCPDDSCSGEKPVADIWIYARDYTESAQRTVSLMRQLTPRLEKAETNG